jgi:hypothetical protein
MPKSKEDQEIVININDFALNRRHIKIILALSEAPDEKKTIHYLQMLFNKSYFPIYLDVKSLVEIDFIHTIKNPHTNKVLYFPSVNIVEAIKKALAGGN